MHTFCKFKVTFYDILPIHTNIYFRFRFTLIQAMQENE